MRWAFKFAYLGQGFHGYQRQPGLRTVEGDILETLLSNNIIDGARQNRLQSASRTDRAVSALGNAIAFDCSTDTREVIQRLNTSLTDIWFYAYGQVPVGFNPRDAEERWYRYHFPESLLSRDVEKAAEMFRGKHDFSSFCKSRAGGTCNITEIDLKERRGWATLDIKADRFLWNMVRRIAGSLRMVAAGELTPSDITGALAGRAVTIEPAPPQYLWLMDISYTFPFQSFLPDKTREAVARAAADRRLQQAFFEALERHMKG